MFEKIVFTFFILTITINCSSQNKNEFVLKEKFECSCKETEEKIIQIISDSVDREGVIYYKFIIFNSDTVNIGILVKDKIITIKSPNHYLSDTLLNSNRLEKEGVNDTDLKQFKYYMEDSGNKFSLFGMGINDLKYETNYIIISFDFATSHSRGIGKIKLNKNLKLIEFWYYNGASNFRCS